MVLSHSACYGMPWISIDGLPYPLPMHCPKLSCLGSCQAHPGPRSQFLATFPLSAQCVSGSAAVVQFLRIRIRQTAGIFKFLETWFTFETTGYKSAQFGVSASTAEAQFPISIDTVVNSSNSWYCQFDTFFD